MEEIPIIKIFTTTCNKKPQNTNTQTIANIVDNRAGIENLDHD